MHGGIGRCINRIEQIAELERPITMEVSQHSTSVNLKPVVIDMAVLGACCRLCLHVARTYSVTALFASSMSSGGCAQCTSPAAAACTPWL
jgi:uncharacterized membrane protein